MSIEESTSTSASSEYIAQAIGGRPTTSRSVRQRTPRVSRGRGARLDAEEERRLQDLQERRISEMKDTLHSLDTSQKDLILERVINRSPGVMFDVLSFLEVPLRPDPDPAGLHWCVCGNCREMNTDQERKCCRQHPQQCISKMAYMDFYILDEGVLRLARAAWNDIFALADNAEPGIEQRQFRHAAYRQFVLWQHGRLGVGNRVVIPSCCVCRIRDTFPDPRGQYTGFRVNRLS
nr:uncharacterized protein LOC129435006 [Misgurnus anguillicaudatus]XP_055049511.1 uncharacterized protein LOC129435006 [Misgurnus anguillicaudatus]XP_055049512.1 uncharacterized protein LOC129435006 [Misgurnus anguillicaudatus]XP_055049513.1 uncharacterized protein LOC129435006 [Misgurnus anguillicaudatus]